MAKGVKRPYDVLIADKDAAIAKLEDNYKAKLAKLKAERKDLVESKERERLDKLADVIADSGMTADELQDLIERNKKA